MTLVLAPFPGMEAQVADIARQLKAQVQPIGWRHFPDGESLVSLSGPVAGKDTAILATLRDPDHLALPLRFAAETARELGARSVGLIAPYLAYMRQDRRFHEGEAVSASIFARFLCQSFDWLVTADPHLHRNQDLGVLFGIPAYRVASAPKLAEWIREEVPDAIVIGPDSESEQWAAEVAGLARCPYAVLRKVRLGDRRVEIHMPDTLDLRQRTPVLLDDIAASGETLIGAIRQLLASGAHPPVCVIIHAAFADSAYAEILAAGASRLVTTDTIPHPSNAVRLAGILADAAAMAVRSAAAANHRVDGRGSSP